MRIFLNRGQNVSAVDFVGSNFVAQRAILKSIRSDVIDGSGLTLETAELLLELFIAGNRVSSLEHVDAGGFVSFQDLLGGLDYTPGLLSRRIGWLCQRRWAETKRATPNIADGIHGNCRKVRITELGKSKAGPVWQKYVQQSERLLSGISRSDLVAHYRVNQRISDGVRAPRHREKIEATPARKLKSPPPRKPEPAPEPAPIKNILEPSGEFLD